MSRPVGRLAGSRTASRTPTERLAHAAFLACALCSAALVLSVVGVLAVESFRFFAEVSPLRFLTDSSWNPFFEEPRFGVLPLVAATVQIVAGAAFIALPLGLMTAIYLQFYAGPKASRILSVTVSSMAAVPTVAFGYFALNFMTPALARLWPDIEAFNGASASLVTGLMILPAVAALCREALAAVPPLLLEGGLALGASRGHVVGRILLPAARRGIFAAALLAVARAVGETMIVTMSAGSHARLIWSPLEGIRTLTAFIAQTPSSGGPPAGLEYRTLFAVGVVLFLATYALQAAGRAFLSRPGRRLHEVAHS